MGSSRKGLPGFLPEPTSEDSETGVGENSSGRGGSGDFNLVRTCYEIGGMLGIDPTHLTLRDLLWMMQGKAELEGAKKDAKKEKPKDNVSTMRRIMDGR